MIALWMAYATLVGLLVSLASFALERVARALRLPSRAIWLAALLISAVWPIIALLAPPTRETASLSVSAFLPGVVITGLDRAGSLTSRIAALVSPALNLLLLGIWALVSALLLARMARSLIIARRLRAECERNVVDGVPVCLSPMVGPAVVGWRAMDVVLPRWVLELDAPLRALVLRHEEEHRAARDPLLLLLATLLVAIVPWNAALWWQARRLRLAIEMDCDARVLRAHPGPHRYGLLLLAIAQQRANATALLGPALSEPASNLERRIIAMRQTAPRASKLQLVSLCAGAALAIAIACSVHSPDRVVGPQSASPTSKAVKGQATYFEFQISKPATPLPGTGAPRYPDDLRAAKIEGEVLTQFVVDTTGLAIMSTLKVLKSTDDRFTEAVRLGLANMRFSPAEVNGRKVKQLLQMPFMFSLSKS